MHNLWVLFIYFFLLVMLPSEIPKLPIDLPMRGFPGVWKFLLFHDSLPGMGLNPSVLLSLFLSFIFCLPPFEYNGLPFRVHGVLCLHSDVVL